MEDSIRNTLDRAKELRKDPKGLYGLCSTLRLRQLDCDLLLEIFSSWEHYTGSIEYPVPSPYFPADDVVELARRAYDGARDMYEGAYGALRIKLLDHLITSLEKELGGADDNGKHGVCHTYRFKPLE